MTHFPLDFKVGDIFGSTNKDVISINLVESTHDDVIRAIVINGQWPAVFDVNTGQETSGLGKVIHADALPDADMLALKVANDRIGRDGVTSNAGLLETERQLFTRVSDYYDAFEIEQAPTPTP